MSAAEWIHLAGCRNLSTKCHTYAILPIRFGFEVEILDGSPRANIKESQKPLYFKHYRNGVHIIFNITYNITELLA